MNGHSGIVTALVAVLGWLAAARDDWLTLAAWGAFALLIIVLAMWLDRGKDKHDQH